MLAWKTETELLCFSIYLTTSQCSVLDALTGKYQSLELHLVIPTSAKNKVLVLTIITSLSYISLSTWTSGG